MLKLFQVFFKINNALTFSELKFNLNLLMVNLATEKTLSDDVEVDGILRMFLETFDKPG